MKKLIFLAFIGLILCGCATSSRYVSYTQERFAPKPADYYVAVYPASKHVPASKPYTVIGKVEVQGYASDGVTPALLTDQAIAIARKKGADGIINADTQVMTYRGAYVIPGHYGYYFYHPARYIPYQNQLLEFSGDLIIYRSA